MITQGPVQTAVYTPKPTLLQPGHYQSDTKYPVQTPVVTPIKTQVITPTLTTHTQTIPPISELPQYSIQPTQPPQPGPTESEISEQPQAPIQISLIPDIFNHSPQQQPDDSDSLSEAPQAYNTLLSVTQRNGTI